MCIIREGEKYLLTKASYCPKCFEDVQVLHLHFFNKPPYVLTWDSPIDITSLVGLYGSAILFWIIRMYKNNPGKLITIPIIFLICAGVLLIHPISSEYDKSTQGGSLFLVAQYLPTLFSTPIIYWILFPIGSIYLFILARQLASN